MSDVSPYGTHQHAAPGAVRAHALVGEPIDHVTVNQVGGSSPASFSTAPYKKPVRRGNHGQRACAGVSVKGKPCTAMALKDSEFCRHHDPDWYENEPAEPA